MKIFFCITIYDERIFSLTSGAPDPPRRCAMGNRTASSLTFAVSLFKLCSTIIRGFRLNTFPFNPRQVNRNHYCSSLASKGFLLPLLSSMVIILLQCIAGYGGGLPQKLHLTLVSPLAVVVVNTSTPVGGDVSIVIMLHRFVIICHHQCNVFSHCQHFNTC